MWDAGRVLHSRTEVLEFDSTPPTAHWTSLEGRPKSPPPASWQGAQAGRRMCRPAHPSPSGWPSGLDDGLGSRGRATWLNSSLKHPAITATGGTDWSRPGGLATCASSFALRLSLPDRGQSPRSIACIRPGLPPRRLADRGVAAFSHTECSVFRITLHSVWLKQAIPGQWPRVKEPGSPAPPSPGQGPAERSPAAAPAGHDLQSAIGA